MCQNWSGHTKLLYPLSLTTEIETTTLLLSELWRSGCFSLRSDDATATLILFGVFRAKKSATCGLCFSALFLPTAQPRRFSDLTNRMGWSWQTWLLSIHWLHYVHLFILFYISLVLHLPFINARRLLNFIYTFKRFSAHFLYGYSVCVLKCMIGLISLGWLEPLADFCNVEVQKLGAVLIFWIKNYLKY